MFASFPRFFPFTALPMFKNDAGRRLIAIDVRVSSTDQAPALSQTLFFAGRLIRKE